MPSGIAIAVTLLSGALSVFLGVLFWAGYRKAIRAQRHFERIFRALASDVRSLERRVGALEPTETGLPKRAIAGKLGERLHGRSSEVAAPGAAGRAPRLASADDSTLISVPDLEATNGDSGASIQGIKERHAAIWELADSGATAETIARATGQPIGQIELILGLRRRIDSGKSGLPQQPVFRKP
jgi:hypothetical protein